MNRWADSRTELPQHILRLHKIRRAVKMTKLCSPESVMFVKKSVDVLSRHNVAFMHILLCGCVLQMF